MENIYDKVMSYIKNNDNWSKDDIELFTKLDIKEPMIGPERKKWKFFYDYIKLKLLII
jgi:hypothetical protein